MSATPIVATMIGDPCGIGPEVVVKALAASTLPSRMLLVGDATVVQSAIALTRSYFSVRRVRGLSEARFEPGCLDVLDPGDFEPRDVTPGRVSAACGRAVTTWMDVALGLAREGKVSAVVKAPTNMEAIKLGGLRPRESSGQSYLFLITGRLRVVHLTDHIPFREVLAEVTYEKVLGLIRLLDDSLGRWGFAQPRIGVAGINPHAYLP